MSNDKQEAGGTAEVMHPATQIANVSREDFGATELEVSGELGTAAMIAQAKAAVESRFKMALARPRRWDQVRVKVLDACRNPVFADEALYAVPRGMKKDERTGQWVENIIEGLSIRFVELALRCMGNTATKVVITHEDERKLVVNVSVTDLESNTTYDNDLTIAKTMERSKLRDGQTAIGVRTNSAGKRVYIVEAPDSEMLSKTQALVSKTIRTNGLRIIDGDVASEALELCRKVLADKAAKDPAGERKAIADAFMTLRITPVDLEQYLGTTLDRAQPAQIVDLRGLFRALRDGAVTWQDVIEGKAKPIAPAAAAVPAPAPQPAPATTPAPVPQAAPPPPAAVEPPAAPPPRRKTQAEIDEDGRNGIVPGEPPDEPVVGEVAKPDEALTVALGVQPSNPGKAVKVATPAPLTVVRSEPEPAPFDKAIDDARQRDEARAKAAADKPKGGKGTSAARAAVARNTAKPAAAPAPQGGLFQDAPPPGDDDLPAWAGGTAKPPDGQPF